MKYIVSILTVLVFVSANAPERTLGEIQWVSFEEAVKLNKENPKKLLIDLYTDWCGWCKKMDRDTYSKQRIIDIVNDNFYAVKFDAEQKEEVLFNGHTFKFVPSGRRGYHELAAALTNNQLSYPTTVFMDEDFRIIQPLPGYYGAKDFEVIIAYIGEGKYTDTPFDQYKKSFKSQL